MLRGWRSNNLCLKLALSDRLTVSSHKNAILFRQVLNLIIHISNKTRSITCKNSGSCYTKYKVHHCNGNVGITNCTNNYSDNNKFTQIFSGCLRIIYLNLKTKLFLKNFSNCYLWGTIAFDKLYCLPLRAFLSKLQGNKYKYYTNPFV